MYTEHTTKVIIIADAWTHGLFNDCLADGMLPEIEKNLCRKGTFYSKVVSNFPSVSLSSHTTLLTGVNQEVHGIPGHRWVFTGSGKVRNYIGKSFWKVNGDISPDVNTVFEANASNDTATFSIQSVICKGAQRKVFLRTIDSEQLLEKSADLIVNNPGGIFVIWLPKGDIVSHKFGPGSIKMVNEMIATSRGIGKLYAKLQGHKMLETTKVLFTADHGQKEVDQYFQLSDAFKLLGIDAEVNPHRRVSKEVALFTNGDSSAFVYFDKLKYSADRKFDVLYKLAERDEIDLIFLKYNSSLHYIFSREGISSIERIGAKQIIYRKVEGSDPLELLTGNDNVLEIENLDEPIDGKYPDIIHQYLGSYIEGRSCDVIITAAGKYHFSNAPRFGWRFGYHRGSHGGATREEMMFSAIVADNSEPKRIDTIVRSKDLIHYLQKD